MSKWGKRIGVGLILLLVALIVLMLVLYWTKIASISTIEELRPGNLYVMEYKADYDLDGLLNKNLENDDIFVEEAIKQTFPLLPVKMQAPDVACSTLMTETPDGKHVMGRNFDWSETSGLMVKTAPKNGYRSIAMVDLSIIDVHPSLDMLDKITMLTAPYVAMDGMNEAGLAIAILQLDDEPTYQDTGKTPIITQLAVRLVLDKAATVDEAVDLLSQYDMRASGNACLHFHITDRNGGSVVVEYPNNVLTVVPSMVCTNHYLTEGALAKEIATSRERFAKVSEILNENDYIMSPESAMGILDCVHMDLMDGGIHYTTQWSAIYKLDEAAATIVMQQDYEHPYEIKIK